MALDYLTELEMVVCANWRNDFSGLKKYENQGYKSIVYDGTDAEGNLILLKTIPSHYWTEQDAVTITAQQILAGSGLMAKIHQPLFEKNPYIQHNDQYLFLQEMISGREADFNNAVDFDRTKKLLDLLHGFDTKILPLKTENPLEFLTSKRFNDVLHDPKYKNRFPRETIAAVHKVFTSIGQCRQPEFNEGNLVVVHGDIKPEHVLLTEDIIQDRLIDCDTLHLGLPEEDYARLLTPQNVEQFLKAGGKIDQQALAYHQHLFLLGELSSVVNAITTYADRMNMPESFIQEQNKYLQEIVPERLKDITAIARTVKLAGFRQQVSSSAVDKAGYEFSKPKF